MAGYCSRECQVTAWKEGHKSACKNLHSRYTEFQKSLKAVDDAHSSSEETQLELYGTTLNDGIDYDILRRTTLRQSMMDVDGNIVDTGLPSMQDFYMNLGRVTRGEWWFFPNAEEAAYAEELNRGKEDGEHFRVLCHLMCQSKGPVCQSMLNDGGTSGGVGFLETQNQTTLKMPASRFLEIYRITTQSFGDADKKRLRREMRSKAYHAFVKKYHTNQAQFDLNKKVLENLVRAAKS